MNVHDLLPLLPDPAVLAARCRAFAVLDTVLDPTAPMHTYQPNWREGVDLARMENGSGDQWGIVFDPAGVFLHGFDHECDATPWREDPRAHWPGLLDGLPASLAHYATTPELQFEGFLDATVCAWRETGAAAWHCGPVTFAADESDGTEWLFDLLADGSAEAYANFAEENWDRPIDLDAVRAILTGAPLTRHIVATLSPTANFETKAERVHALGHPVSP
ncbi:hypothetical protein [Streptomyces sp. NPDC059575]|uniref:hypothetical protein n=1 Tax=Streptomyces sp. NPDC059575 TaxID=3346872 RepID=UPI0036A7C857